MPSPFPGMDPYLETPELWPDVHHELLSQIRGQLNPQLRPHYVARVELCVYVSNENDPGRLLVPDDRVEKLKNKKGRQRKESAPKNGSALAIAELELVPISFTEETKEARLEIRHLKSGTLITVIELLSPSNKIFGSAARNSFFWKKDVKSLLRRSIGSRSIS